MYSIKSQLMNDKDIERTVLRISHQIVEKCFDLDSVCIIGIRRRGVPLARMIADNLSRISDLATELGERDITLYRDDLKALSEQPTVNATYVPFDITGKTVILVDDVIYTGRTARAAIDALFKLGRPACVKLCVLLDRGHRELPIRGDFVGKNVPTSKHELIAVRMPEFDGAREAVILDDQQGLS